MTWLLFTHLACTNSKSTDTAPEQIDTVATGLVMATVAMDYSVGALATFDPEIEILNENISSISGDPALVLDAGFLWQINRYQYDTLRKYDLSNLQVPLTEVSLAPDVGSSNPHDVAICGGQVFVSLYGAASLPVLDIDTLSETSSIDLTEWADEDGIPEASSMVVVDDQLFVGLQRLDRNAGFTPLDSIVLQVDCATQTVTNSWEVGQNIELIEWDDDVAMVSQDSNSNNAGIFTLSDTNWTRIWSTEGSMSSTVYADGQIFYSSLSADQTQYTLHCVNMDTGTVTVSEPWSEYITDLLIIDGVGWVGAHWGWSDPSNSSPGLYQVYLDTCTVESHWPMELAPFSMVYTP